MTIKLHTLVANAHIMTGHSAYHLWHERTPQRCWGQPFYQRNLARVQQYKGLSASAMQNLCENQRRSMGNMNKYQFSNS